MNEQQTKLRAADALLERGVRVRRVRAPFILSIFGIRTWDIVLRQPVFADLIRVSRIIVSMGLNPADLEGLTQEGAFRIVRQHGASALRVLAVVAAPRWIPIRLYAWWMGRILTPTQFAEAWVVFTLTSGTADFISTIRLMLKADNLSPTTAVSTQDE